MQNDWYKDAVFYEVFVRSFADSNGDGIGDLPGLTARLDYLQALGVDAIWMLPIFPSPLRDDGYDVADYFAVHPDYGTLDDFRRLVSEAHRRGLRIVVELIPNHTSDQHPWFQASADPAHPDHAVYRDWYVWSDTSDRYNAARIIFLDTEPSNWTFDPRRGQYFWHRFFHHQPDLNYDNPAVQRAMLRVVQFWLDLGADAFRVDATPYLFEREGASGENLPETHAFLKRLRQFVDAYAPGAMLLSEANQWPEDVLPYFGKGDEFHMNFHFPLMPRLFMALARSHRAPIQEILARTPPLPAGCQWATFLRCHDELTLEMVTLAEREFMWNFYAPDPRMRLNLGIRRRLAPLLGNDRRRIELANSLLLTLPGSPVIYYGDEIGMGDNIWLQDRDGVRTPMQWSDAANAGFSSAHPTRVQDPVIDDVMGDRTYSFRRVNVADQEADPGSLLNTMRRLLAVRRQHPVFGRGDFAWLACDCAAVAAYARAGAAERLFIVQNLSALPQAASIELPISAPLPPILGEPTAFPPAAADLHDLLSGRRLVVQEDGRLALNLAPYEYLWLG